MDNLNTVGPIEFDKLSRSEVEVYFQHYSEPQIDIKAIVKEQFGVSNFGFTIERHDKGTHVRTNVYTINITLKDNTVGKIFFKDTFNLGEGHDVSRSLQKDYRLEQAELPLSRLLTARKGYTPRSYAYSEFPDQNGFYHRVMLMEHFDTTVEDVMVGLSHLSDTEKAQKQAVDYVKRAIDVYFLNLSLMSDYPSGSIYPLNSEVINRDLCLYLDTFIDSLYPSSNKDVNENIDKNNFIRKTAGITSPFSLVANVLSQNAGRECIALFNPYPAHILINNSALGIQYPDQSMIEEIAKDGRSARDADIYEGIAITDLQKVARTLPSVGIAAIISHPSITNIIPEGRLDELVEHAYDVWQKLGKGRITEDKLFPTLDEFKQRCTLAGFLSCLRNIYFISSLGLRNPEGLSRLEEVRPIYGKHSFLSSNIRRIGQLCESDLLRSAQTGVREVEKELYFRNL